MPVKKPVTQPDDPEQYRRFVEEARKAGVDETDPDAMDRAFDRVMKPKTSPTAAPSKKDRLKSS